MLTKSNAMNRRSVLTGMALGLLPGLNRPAFSAVESFCKVEAKAGTLKARPERAVSLRQLSEALAAGKPAKFDGLTRLDGYITDKENRDIILWGLAEKGQPELVVADFAVALRAAHERYTVVRDGTTYLTEPLISIDPDPEVFRILDGINLSSADGKRRQEEVCRSPQTVRVEGMPRHCRVAKVLVDADYRMKLVGQGQVTLPIASAFPAAFNERVKLWKKQDEEGIKSHGFHTRYWFQPGKFGYQVSAESDTVFLDTAQVVLHDEDQRLKPGALVASGNIDSISRSFTCAWTERMEDTYRAEPIWRDMHNIFRHFALARVMKDRKALTQVEFAGDYLLDKFDIPKVELPPSLPGTGRIIEYETKSGRTTTRHTSSTCGGVSVQFEKFDQTPDAGQTRASGRSVIASRPAPTTIAWAVTPGTLQGIFNSKPSAPTVKPPDSTVPESKKPSLRDLFKT
jgi:hypothetical protein